MGRQNIEESVQDLKITVREAGTELQMERAELISPRWKKLQKREGILFSVSQFLLMSDQLRKFEAELKVFRNLLHPLLYTFCGGCMIKGCVPLYSVEDRCILFQERVRLGTVCKECSFPAAIAPLHECAMKFSHL